MVIRITRAYCVELERVVTADAARREFLSLEIPPRRFNFLCADDRCRAAGTRVSGVSYRTAAREQEKYRTVHFRRWDDHVTGCPEEGELEDVTDEPPNESDGDTLRRRAQRKLTDFVDIFDPRPGDDTPTGDRSVRGPQARDSAPDGKSVMSGKRGAQGAAGMTRTRYLEKLVDTFLEAQSKLSEEEFLALRVHVINVGDVSLREYFCQMKRATCGISGRVLYGGAALIKRYGAGFKLKFFDSVDGLPVFLYVAPHVVAEYRYKRYLNHVLSHKVGYFRVFAIGELRHDPSKRSVDLIVKEMRHLAIVLPPKTPGSPSASSSVETR